MKSALYAFTVLLAACGAGCNTSSRDERHPFKAPFLIDSVAVPEKAYETFEMQQALNYLIYTGSLTDTIKIHENDGFHYVNYTEYQENEKAPGYKPKLKIYTSKNQLLAVHSPLFSEPPLLLDSSNGFEIDSIATAKAYEEWLNEPKVYIQSIPVFIYNASDDTAYLNHQDGRIIMIQEAKDERGQWKPIELWRYSWCGNSYAAQGLLPNYLAIVTIFKYDGDFETDIRLKLRNGKEVIYSDSFRGKINKSQFELPRDIVENVLPHKPDKKRYINRLFLNE